MMELAYSVRLEPGDFVAKVAVKDRESFLRQRPSIADVYLQTESKTHIN